MRIRRKIVELEFTSIERLDVTRQTDFSQIFLHDITFSFHGCKKWNWSIRKCGREFQNRNAMITINHITRGARNFPFVWNPCHFFSSSSYCQILSVWTKVFVCKSENVDNSNDVYILIGIWMKYWEPNLNFTSFQPTTKIHNQQNSEKSNTLLFTMQTLSPNDDQITEIVAMIALNIIAMLNNNELDQSPKK